jgi:hypothetical protein
MSKEELARRITSMASAFFRDTGQPYLLSRIPPDLDGLAYKDIVGEQTLKEFIEGLSELRIVRHPTQKAKIGVVPASAEFSFGDASDAAFAGRPIEGPQKRRSPASNALMSLLQALAHLEPEEVDTVHIPVRIMIKLAGIR